MTVSQNARSGEFIALFRHRLEESLGCVTALTLDLGNENGTPIDILVFATDHPAGSGS